MSKYKENAKFVKGYLDGDGWTCEMEDQGKAAVFISEIGGFNGIYNSYKFMLFVGDYEVQNYAFFPTSAKDKLPEMAEFITRANYGLKYGDFEMDWNDGEVRFHLSFPMSAVNADEMILPTLLMAPPKMLDKYSKGFAEVLMGLKKPADAIKDCEGA